jgi:ribosomal protein L3
MAGDSGVLKVTGEQLELALVEAGTPVLLVTGGILGR